MNILMTNSSTLIDNWGRGLQVSHQTLYVVAIEETWIYLYHNEKVDEQLYLIKLYVVKQIKAVQQWKNLLQDPGPSLRRQLNVNVLINIFMNILMIF